MTFIVVQEVARVLKQTLFQLLGLNHTLGNLVEELNVFAVLLVDVLHNYVAFIQQQKTDSGPGVTALYRAALALQTAPGHRTMAVHLTVVMVGSNLTVVAERVQIHR